MREASRGNFTRMAGSATILTTALQGVGPEHQGLVANLLTMFGLLKTTADAELAQKPRRAARRRGSGRLGRADRRGEGHRGRRRARARRSPAEDRDDVRTPRRPPRPGSPLRTRRSRRPRSRRDRRAGAGRRPGARDGSRGSGQHHGDQADHGRRGADGALTGTAIAAGLLYTTFKVFQDQVRDQRRARRYANSLGLTKKEMKELRQEVGGLSSKEMKDLDARARAFQITWGDVFHGLAKTASDALDLSPAWKKFKGRRERWISVLKSGANAAAHLYGLWTGTYRTLVQTFGGFANAVGSAFVGAVNAAIGRSTS
jgi:hypothetical protein